MELRLVIDQTSKYINRIQVLFTQEPDIIKYLLISVPLHKSLDLSPLVNRVPETLFTNMNWL